MTYREAEVPPTSRRALEVLALFSKKWHPVVVATLRHHSPLGFNDLLEMLPDVSGKVLTETLEALQDAGLIERRVVTESPLRVEYDLTDAGRDVGPVFDALGDWGERHLESATPRVLLADADRRITGMYRQWLDDRYTVARAHDSSELDVRFDERTDAVLLDEGLPGTDPATFAAEHREECRIVVLVGDRPAFDLLEVACDDVLRKPIVRETALETIGEQLAGRTDADERRKRASLLARKSLFESVYAPERLASNEQFQRLTERLDALEDDELS